MNIYHISDTHGFHREIPMDRFEGVDIVVHSGDCSNYMSPAMNMNEVWDFLEWYMTVPVEHKIYVAGNHDTSIERKMIRKENFTDRGIVYLEHDMVNIHNLNIFGSPYTPTFGTWAFMKAREKINKVWQTMPTDIDILITHGPAKGVRDLSEEKDGSLKQCGDSALMKWIFNHPPKAHLFGHIHDMKGVHNQGTSKYSKCKTIFSNATCVTDGRFDLGLTSFGNYINI